MFSAPPGGFMGEGRGRENKDHLLRAPWDLRTRLAAALDRLRPAGNIARFLLDEGRILVLRSRLANCRIRSVCRRRSLQPLDCRFQEFRLLWVKEQAERQVRSEKNQTIRHAPC